MAYLMKSFLGSLVSYMRVAVEASTKELYDLEFDKAIALTNEMEAVVYKAEYAEADQQLLRTLTGLKSLSEQDLEGAKLQAAFFVGDLEKLMVRLGLP